MSHTITQRTLAMFFLIILFSFSGQAAAQDMTKAPPHAEEDGSVGQFQGFVFTQAPGGKTTPLAQQPMQLVVFQNEQSVLVLPKVSGADGKFVIKNIFRDEAFEYALSTEYQGKTYTISHLKLAGDEQMLPVNFQVGLGSPSETKSVPATNLRVSTAPPQKAPTKKPTTSGHKRATKNLDDWQRPFNIVTTLLVLVALGLAAHYSTRKQS